MLGRVVCSVALGSMASRILGAALVGFAGGVLVITAVGDLLGLSNGDTDGVCDSDSSGDDSCGDSVGTGVGNAVGDPVGGSVGLSLGLKLCLTKALLPSAGDWLRSKTLSVGVMLLSK